MMLHILYMSLYQENLKVSVLLPTAESGAFPEEKTVLGYLGNIYE